MNEPVSGKVVSVVMLLDPGLGKLFRLPLGDWPSDMGPSIFESLPIRSRIMTTETRLSAGKLFKSWEKASKNVYENVWSYGFYIDPEY